MLLKMIGVKKKQDKQQLKIFVKVYPNFLFDKNNVGKY